VEGGEGGEWEGDLRGGGGERTSGRGGGGRFAWKISEEENHVVIDGQGIGS